MGARSTPTPNSALATRATEALAQAAGASPRRLSRARRRGARRGPTRSCSGLGYRYDASLGDAHAAEPAAVRPRAGAVRLAWRRRLPLPPRDRPPSRPPCATPGLPRCDKAAARGGLFVTVCHAVLTGVDPARVAALDAVIEAAQAAGVAIRTVGEVAAAPAG